MNKDWVKKLIQRATEDAQFFHKLVFQPAEVINEIGEVDPAVKQVILNINAREMLQNLISNQRDRYRSIACEQSATCHCTSGTCNNTCYSSSCHITQGSYHLDDILDRISGCGGDVTCSCTSGTCGDTCGGSTCGVTCSGDSCGSTCGDSCGYTTNHEVIIGEYFKR